MDEVEIVTIETCKGRFPEDDSAKELHRNIQAILDELGTKRHVMYHFVVKEMPELFDEKFIARVRSRMAENYSRRNRNAVNPNPKFWTHQQRRDLLGWWTWRTIQEIADGIGKTHSAVRAKAREIMTQEEYDSRYRNIKRDGNKLAKLHPHWKKYRQG